MNISIVVLLIVAGAVLFVCAACGVVPLVFFLIGRFGGDIGGRRRLVELYATPSPPAGQIFQQRTVKIGAVTYKHCVTVGIADEGLYLTIWRKTVLLPWGEFKGFGKAMLYWQPMSELTVGNPPLTTITVQNDLFAMMRGRLTA